MAPDSPLGIVEAHELIRRLIQWSAGLAFVALLLILFYSGIRFILSGGDDKSIKSASQSITYALMGIALMIGAWLILLFVKAVTGIDVTNFCIGFKPFC